MSDSSPPTTSAPLLTPLLAADLAEYCLRATGPSSVQLVGEALAHLSTTLLAAGCEVSRYEAVTPCDAAVDMVIAWAASGEECSRFLAPGAAAVVIVGPAGAVQDAETWVAQAASLGWQQHPAPFALSGASDDVTVRVFARSGVSVTDPASLLRASYHGLAAALVRPGDAVLAMDAAEGDLWRIVLQQSRCSWLGVVDDQLRPAGEPGVEWLGSTQWQPAPRPIDVVVTRLSHDGSDWMQEVQAAHAALVRSGRLVVAVPLDSGRNPLQRDLLALLEQSGLVIDRAWWQSLTRPAGPDQFIEVSRDAAGQLKIDSDSVATADALVLMAVKVDGPGIAQDPSLKAPNVIAFHRDYLDASVVRLIVAVGLRLESATLRRPIARKVMHEAPVDSADYGAAVCVFMTRWRWKALAVPSCLLPRDYILTRPLPTQPYFGGRCRWRLPPRPCIRPAVIFIRPPSCMPGFSPLTSWPSVRCWVPKPPLPLCAWDGYISAEATLPRPGKCGLSVWMKPGAWLRSRIGRPSSATPTHRKSSPCPSLLRSWMRRAVWRLRCG
jgi:hypothetical protein